MLEKISGDNASHQFASVVRVSADYCFHFNPPHCQSDVNGKERIMKGKVMRLKMLIRQTPFLKSKDYLIWLYLPTQTHMKERNRKPDAAHRNPQKIPGEGLTIN